MIFCVNSFAQDGLDVLKSRPITDPFAASTVHNRPTIRPGAVTLSSAEIVSLIDTPRGAAIKLPSLDVFTDNLDEPLEYQRVSIFAEGAKVSVIDQRGRHRFEPAIRHFFLASNSTTAVGLAVNPETGEVRGYAIKGGAELEVSGSIDVSLEFLSVAVTADGANECGTQTGDQPPSALSFLDDGIFDSQSAASAGSSLDFQAVIAIDTDTEWLAGFNNDTSDASDWIADLFLAMNVMYERDLGTRLLIGDVFLRTGSDPYSVTGGSFDKMNEFSEYWRLNQGGINRDFAAMFSGRGVCSGCYSGIAWVNQYCENGWVPGGVSYTVGSYSYNGIGSNRTPGNTAIFVGHELGHNMGSSHTHCYNPPVDECYGSEGGCYSGPVSCPATGTGTTMSYCHVGGNSGGAGCGSTADFHPTVQSLLEGRLSSNTPSCIAPFEEPGPEPEIPIFSGSFESG